MAKRKRRKKNSQPEGIFFALVFFGIIAFAIVNMLQNMYESAKAEISSWTAGEWLMIACALCIIVFFVTAARRGLRSVQQRSQRKQSKIRLHRARTTQQLSVMDPYDFEHHVADVFRTQGYAAQVTPKSKDGGKDIILRKGKVVRLVECKRYNTTKVTRPHIQKFHSAIIDTRADGGYFVTNGSFTKSAVEYAKGKNIILIDGSNLVNQVLAELQKKEVGARKTGA